MSNAKNYLSYGLAVALATSLSSPALSFQEEVLDIGFQDQTPSYGEVRLLPAAPPQEVRVQERRVAPIQQPVVMPQTLTQQYVQQPMIQQPMTYVEAAPVEDSKAARLRKAREGAEVQTEQKIVEKLEESRLRDEKRRAERLFGNRLSESEEDVKAPVVQEVPAPPHQVVVIKEQPVARDEKPADLEKEASEVERDFLQRARLEAKVKEPVVAAQTYYISAGIGLAEYAEMTNIYGELATGFAVGTEMPNGVVIEGSFLYSNFIVDEFWRYNSVFREMDQYNVGLAVKYNLLQGNLRPNVGGIVSYTHRRYGDRQRHYSPQSRHRSYPTDGEATSNAFDLGLSAGLDLKVTENFSIGTEFRYMMNVINKSESEFLRRSSYWAPRYSSPIEEFSYYSWTLNGKVHF